MKGETEYKLPFDVTDDGDDGTATGSHDGSQSQRLIDLATECMTDSFHTADGTAYVVVPVDGHAEVLNLRAKPFRALLYKLSYQEFRKPPGVQALQDALAVLEARALFEGPERPVHVRVAEHAGRIYLDLADEGWRVVEIEGDGWRVLDRSPVMFRRPKGLAPLPVPVHGGELDELREFVNVDDSDWPLLVGFLLACLSPWGPYPALVIVAEQGAGKSTQARLVKSLVDANLAPLRSAPRDERDLMIAASNSWVLAFDNLSGLSPMLSDALCRLSTGGGYATRELYTDVEETILDAMRPVILTGIDDLATRPDLLDRSIILSLPHISKNRRLSEREISKGFASVRPRVLGALLTAASHALKTLPHTKLRDKPRMLDFATWVVAAEPATGLVPGAFMQAYNENRTNANGLVLDVNSMARVLEEFARRRGEWRGTAGELLAELTQLADVGTRGHRAWPKSASSMAQKLRRVAPNLRECGIAIDFLRSSAARTIRISCENAVTAVMPSSNGHESSQAHESDDDGIRDGSDAGPVMPARPLSQQGIRVARQNDGSDVDDGVVETRS